MHYLGKEAKPKVSDEGPTGTS